MNKFLLPMLLFLLAGAAHAQEIVFTAETTTGDAVVTPVLSWSTNPAADSCTASGDWTGAKLSAGSETLPDIQSSATYILDCFWTTGMATLTWTPPTTNTDGTTLTDLTSYKIYQLAGGEVVSETLNSDVGTVPPFVINDLPAGDHCWVVAAINSRGIEGPLSNESCKTITAESSSRGVAITVNPAPSGIVDLGVL